MLPYLESKPLSLGPLSISYFSLLLATGVALGYWMAVRRARQMRLDGNVASGLVMSMLAFGFPASVAFKCLYYPDLAGRGWAYCGLSSFGGIAGGMLGGLLFAWWKRIGSTLLIYYLNVAAFIAPIGFALGRVGCSLAHDHPGILSASIIAVQYPGGARYDLGVLECFYLTILIGAFRLLDTRRPAQPFLSIFLVLYGSFRFFVDRLHEDPVRYFGWTVDQLAAIFMVSLGLCLRIITTPRTWGTSESTESSPSCRPGT